MTAVVEKNQTPKATKTWGEKIDAAVASANDNGRYAKFAEFVERESNGSVQADIKTIALVMKLLNQYRLTTEYKDWDKEYRESTAATGGTKTAATPKTPEQIREYAQKAQKAVAAANARAERARIMLAELDGAEDGDDHELVGENDTEDENDDENEPF